MGIFKKANQDHPIYRSAVLIPHPPALPQRNLIERCCPENEAASTDKGASVSRDSDDVIESSDPATETE